MTLIEKNKHRFLATCLTCLVLIASTIVPTYALEETTEAEISTEISEPSVNVSPEPSERLETLTKRVDDLTVQVSDLTNAVQVLCAQMSQFMVTTIPEEGNQVVDISPESVDAIAMAVSDSEYQYAYQYSFSIDNMSYPFVIDTDIPDLITSDTKMWVTSTWQGTFLKVAGDGFYIEYLADKDYDRFYNFSQKQATLSNGAYVVSFEDFNDGFSAVASATVYRSNEVRWANHTLLYSNGQVFYQVAGDDGSGGEDPDPDVPPGSGEVPVDPVYTITFVTNASDISIDSMTSTDFVAPTPSREGYVFGGWYFDEDLTEKYTPGFEFTENTTLYAQWLEKSQMSIIHKTMFNSLVEVFKTEPVIYIFSLIGLVIVIGIVRKWLGAR